METLIYILRCLTMLVVTWTAIRIIGKKSISEMTAYDLASVMLLSTAAAEPLVYKIPSKASVGAFTIAFAAVIIGHLSMKKPFYNLDNKPDILINNGKIDKDTLKKNKMNVPFLMSLLRIKGYSAISEVEFALIEPNGKLSVIPKSQNRPVQPKDLKIDTKYEGITLPLILEGEIQYNNLKFVGLTDDWLSKEITKAGAKKTNEIFFAHLDTQGRLYVDLYNDDSNTKYELDF